MLLGECLLVLLIVKAVPLQLPLVFLLLLLLLLLLLPPLLLLLLLLKLKLLLLALHQLLLLLLTLHLHVTLRVAVCIGVVANSLISSLVHKARPGAHKRRARNEALLAPCAAAWTATKELVQLVQFTGFSIFAPYIMLRT